MTWSGRAACPLVILLVLLMPAPARAQVAFEFFLGTAFNVPTTLTVDQTGYPPIAFTAHYEVKPLDDYAYYAYRMGLWQNNRAWIVDTNASRVHSFDPVGDTWQSHAGGSPLGIDIAAAIAPSGPPDS